MVAAGAASKALSPRVRELYPWNGKYIKVADGIRMHYLDEGSGETLLMLHGNPTWSFYWRNMVKEFSSEYRCIVPDHIGCGLSDKPQDWPYQLAGHIANLGKLVDHLGLSDITLVVHDWGGAIGVGLATFGAAGYGRIASVRVRF